MKVSVAASVSKPLFRAWLAELPPLPCRSSTNGRRCRPSYAGGTNSRYVRGCCPDISCWVADPGMCARLQEPDAADARSCAYACAALNTRNDVTMNGRRIFISFVSRLTRENVAHLSGAGDRDPIDLPART